MFVITVASGSRIPAKILTVTLLNFPNSVKLEQSAALAEVVVRTVATSESAATAAPTSSPFFFDM